MSRLAAWRAVLAEAAAALDFVPASWAAHLVTQTGPNSQRVAIVNQTFVRKFFHGASPVGHYVDKDTMIVGVVEDVAIEPGLDPTAPLSDEESMYIPATQVDARSLALLHVSGSCSCVGRRGGSFVRCELHSSSPAGAREGRWKG